MNRRERRAAARKGAPSARPEDPIKRALREAALLRQKPRRAVLYDLAGQQFQTISERPGHHVAAQWRLVKRGEGFDSVSEAEAAGRLDLVRCFILDRSAPGPDLVYREVPGGHDRLPSAPIAFEGGFQPDLTGFGDVAQLGAEILRTFPEGELWPFEAYALAFISLRVGPDQAADGSGATAVWDFLARTGYTARWSREQIHQSLAKLAQIRRRWFELQGVRP